MRAAKRAARSELSVSRGEWTKHGWASRAAPDLLSTQGLQDTLPRIAASDLTLEEFIERFERPKQPCIITGLCEGWRATQEWTPERLLAKYGDHKFKVGKPVIVSLLSSACA